MVALGLSRARHTVAADAQEVGHHGSADCVPPAAREPRDVLRARLERAPAEHAEAMLAAYDVLQQLHDRGVLDVVRSGLAAGDEMLDKVVDSADTPEAIRALRNLLFWRQVLGRIEPEWFQGIFEAIPDGLAMATERRDERSGSGSSCGGRPARTAFAASRRASPSWRASGVTSVRSKPQVDDVEQI